MIFSKKTIKRKKSFEQFIKRRIAEIVYAYTDKNKPITALYVFRLLKAEGTAISFRKTKKYLYELKCISETESSEMRADDYTISTELSDDDVRGCIWKATRNSSVVAVCSAIAALLAFAAFFFAPRGNYQMIAILNLFILVFLLGVFGVHIRSMIRFRKAVLKKNWQLNSLAEEQLQNTNEHFYKYFLFSVFAVFAVVGSQFLLFNLSENRGALFSSLMSAVSAFKFIYVVLVVLLINASKFYISNSFETERKRNQLKLCTIRSVIFSFCYYLIAILILLLPINRIMSGENWIILITGIYCILSFLGYCLIRKKLEIEKGISRKYRRGFVIGLLLIALFFFMRSEQFYLQDYIGTVAPIERVEDQITYNKSSGVYTITTDKDKFKILQLTDVHLGGSYFSRNLDEKALKTCYSVIKQEKPDLVVVTGDIVFSVGVSSFSLNNTACVRQFAQFMRNTGIPWAFTYGNHDTDSMANGSRADIDKLYTELSYMNSQNLLYPYVKPDISGRCNQLIEIRNTDGSLREAVFLIDSNDYTGKQINDYDYIHDDQVEWYAAEVKRLTKEEKHTPESLVFTHIPLHEYRTAYNLYSSGSDEVEYCFGRLGTGFMIGIGTSAYHSNLFDKMVELDSTHAMFCGHDHLNTFSLIYKGIQMTYGMSIDYLTRPAVRQVEYQRGGTVIEILKDGSHAIRQSPYKP